MPVVSTSTYSEPETPKLESQVHNLNTIELKLKVTVQTPKTRISDSELIPKTVFLNSERNFRKTLSQVQNPNIKKQSLKLNIQIPKFGNRTIAPLLEPHHAPKVRDHRQVKRPRNQIPVSKEL